MGFRRVLPIKGSYPERGRLARERGLQLGPGVASLVRATGTRPVPTLEKRADRHSCHLVLLLIRAQA
jgi:hypothetical protein